MKVIITESQLRKIVSSIISKENNIYGIKQGMSLINEDGRKLFSLEDIKKKISDATSWEDFKEKNPNWGGMYSYIRNNYKNDPYNNWGYLISVFNDYPTKFSLEGIKKKISDATSWEDFKQKNPNWKNMPIYIKKNHENDPDNNWKSLTSVFNYAPTKFSLEGIKKEISDATSWEDFKQKNPNWNNMRNYININYKNDPDNNWESLMSVFDDAPFKYSLEDIKKTISDATSWEDFKEKNTNINSMRNYININYKNDPDNNWESLISHFDDAPFKFSLEGIKKKISDATSWEDFKQKNPNFNSMRNYINQNHKNDSYNNWESLTSVFNDYPTKFSLEGIKKKISDATSWEDFKQKNPNWINMYLYIRKNYKNDPDNNWESLISHFDDRYVERRYQTKSESKGEKKVKSSLIDLGYDVSTQKRFKGCYGFKGKRYCDLLKFDAYVEKKNGKKVCVEFDGEQHFMSVGIFGGDIRLEEQQKHDQLKNNYCKNNGVKLIRIHYLDFKKIEEILKNELGPYEQENMDNNMDMGIFYSRPEEYQHLT
jgi:hypothetical protein